MAQTLLAPREVFEILIRCVGNPTGGGLIGHADFESPPNAHFPRQPNHRAGLGVEVRARTWVASTARSTQEGEGTSRGDVFHLGRFERQGNYESNYCGDRSRGTGTGNSDFCLLEVQILRRGTGCLGTNPARHI